jgi:hypothetical protein
MMLDGRVVSREATFFGDGTTLTAYIAQIGLTHREYFPN